MKIILIGLCALSSFVALAPKTVAQAVTIELSPATNDSYWVWNDEFQCWIWNGPEFQGDYQGHPYSYWHGRHEVVETVINVQLKATQNSQKLNNQELGLRRLKQSCPK